MSNRVSDANKGTTRKAVIFDCDGVLVDSEPIACAVIVENIEKEIGLRMTPEEAHKRFTGLIFSQMEPMLEAETGRAFAPGWVDRHFEDLFARYRAELVAVPGTLDLIDGIEAAGLSWGVASQSPPHYLELVLDIIGLGDRARGRVASSKEVENPKPAPDVYLLACDRVGCAPSEAFVIEDSPTGARAGVLAGATVLGYAADRPAAELWDAGATHVSDRMQELQSFILQSTGR